MYTFQFVLKDDTNIRDIDIITSIYQFSKIKIPLNFNFKRIWNCEVETDNYNISEIMTTLGENSKDHDASSCNTKFITKCYFEVTVNKIQSLDNIFELTQFLKLRFQSENFNLILEPELINSSETIISN